MHDGARAQALVIDKKTFAEGVESRAAAACKYTLRVQFDDGSSTEISRRVWSRELAWLSAGDMVAVRYDPDDRSKLEIDEPALKARRNAERQDAKAEAIARGELALAETVGARATDEPGRPSSGERQPETPAATGSPAGAPSDEELQRVYHAWGTAIASAAAKMETYQAALAAGDHGQAQRELAEGKALNAEQERLGEEFKRLRTLRPDWKSGE